MAEPVIVRPMEAADFAELLRRTIEEEQTNVYRLAKRYALEREPRISRDSAERLIYKWLGGEHFPSRRSREALAAALDRPPDFFSDGVDPIDARRKRNGRAIARAMRFEDAA